MAPRRKAFPDCAWWEKFCEPFPGKATGSGELGCKGCKDVLSPGLTLWCEGAWVSVVGDPSFASYDNVARLLPDGSLVSHPILWPGGATATAVLQLVPVIFLPFDCSPALWFFSKTPPLVKVTFPPILSRPGKRGDFVLWFQGRRRLTPAEVAALEV